MREVTVPQPVLPHQSGGTGRRPVRVLELEDPAGLGEGQGQAESLVAQYTAATMSELAAGRGNPDLGLSDSSPGLSAWMQMRKLAIALHPVYEVPELEHLGGGLRLLDLDRELPDGRRPFQALADVVGEPAAQRARKRYARFLLTPYDDELRVFMQASQDARGIRWRAAAAAVLAAEAATGWTGPLRLVSLACGAAGPVARIADDMTSAGHELKAMLLVDRDPVALAAGRAIAGRHVPDDRVQPVLLDLVDMSTGVATPLAPALGQNQAHLVDVLGLFEYLPDATAVSLLRRARDLLAPGGVVVLANMLDVRPSQDVFDHVIQWPRLVQRSVPALMQLVVAAGFDPDRVQVVVPPAHDALYAVLALRA